DGKMTIPEVKKATVYLKVRGDTWGGSGSGFVIQAGTAGDALIATNAHVVQPPARATSPGRVTVVFNSRDGEGEKEQQVPGEVLVVEPKVDLAILRVKGVAKLPRPIDPRLAAKPVETMPVRAVGFPLGQTLSKDERNPAVTITSGEVTALPRDTTGRL